MADTQGMKMRAPVLVATIAVLLTGPLASPARAATSQGCTGSLSSVDDKGAALDTVSVPGPQGTDSRPFELFWAAPVTWTGQTTQPITTGTWRLSVEQPSVLFALGELVTGHVHGLSGSFATGGTVNSFTNTFTPSNIEPVTLPGLYKVDITVHGAGGATCTAVVSVRVMDPPGRNPLWWLALLLMIAGLVLFVVFGVTKWTRPAVVGPTQRSSRP